MPKTVGIQEEMQVGERVPGDSTAHMCERVVEKTRGIMGVGSKMEHLGGDGQAGRLAGRGEGERMSIGCVCGPACGGLKYGISFASQVLHGACLHAASCTSVTQHIWQVGEDPSLMAENL